MWDTESMFQHARIHVYSYLAVSVAFCAFAVTLFVFLLQQSSQAVQVSALPYNTAQIITLVNKEREKNGLLPLLFDFDLANASKNKVGDMAQNSYFSHVSPQKQRWSNFIITSNYQYIEAGENLANGFETPQDIVDAWLKSPSHRENMLTPQYQDTAVAVMRGQLNGRPTIFVVQMFGVRKHM